MEELTTNTSVDLNCHWLQRNATQAPKITVGELLYVECQLLEGLSLPESLRIVAGEKNDPYILKILSVESVQPNLRLQVTSYRPGIHAEGILKLAGTPAIHLKGLSFETQTVIDPKNPPQGPYGPYGPMALGLPPLYWYSLLGVLIFTFVVSLVWLYRRQKLKNLLRALKRFDSAQPPYFEAQAKLRKMGRDFEFFTTGKLEAEAGGKLLVAYDELLKLYLTRKFIVPAFDWKLAKVLKHIRKIQPLTVELIADDLKVLFREIEKGRKSKVITPSDVHQLGRQVRRFLDKCERLSGGSK